MEPDALDLDDGAAASRAIRVTVAICTYRRAEPLARALDGISRLTFAGRRAPIIHVIVVDNEGCARVRAVVDAFASLSGAAVSYAVEPRRGISQARNAALALVPADADFVAFIDDDERPAPGWLDALLTTQARTGAVVVCGPISPEFSTSPPSWIVEGGFFVHPRILDRQGPEPVDGAPIADARTGNVLIRANELRRSGAHFDEAFGLSGGEDALFFRRLSAAGAVMVWSPAAEVSEVVPAARARFGYLVREYFRCGNVRAAIDALDGGDASANRASSPRHVALTLKKGLKKALVHGGLLVATVIALRGRARAYGHLFEMANAAGRLCYLCGIRYQHYR
ncbi:MAG: glycosyltransferase family 2 protein [Rhodospirillales bacterium]|nr:glycosyltransferase family 2 protein [Rhodospirillales bacterium]